MHVYITLIHTHAIFQDKMRIYGIHKKKKMEICICLNSRSSIIIVSFGYFAIFVSVTYNRIFS
jgi:hypothetical protein